MTFLPQKLYICGIFLKTFVGMASRQCLKITPSADAFVLSNQRSTMGKIIIAGIGPGSRDDITAAVLEAVSHADVIVGYHYYFQFIAPYLPEGCECIDTGMKKERERAEEAFRLAAQDKTVVVISSGDAGI